MKLDISKSNKIYDTKNVEHLYKPEIIELVRLFTDVFGDRKCLINESRMIFTSKKSNVTMLQRFNFGPFCVPLNGQSWDMTPSEHNLSRKLFEGFEN